MCIPDDLKRDTLMKMREEEQGSEVKAHTGSHRRLIGRPDAYLHALPFICIRSMPNTNPFLLNGEGYAPWHAALLECSTANDRSEGVQATTTEEHAWPGLWPVAKLASFAPARQEEGSTGREPRASRIIIEPSRVYRSVLLRALPDQARACHSAPSVVEGEGFGAPSNQIKLAINQNLSR